MPVKLNGKCDLLTIKNRDELNTVVSLFEIVPISDKYSVYSKILLYLKNSNETVTIEENHPLCKFIGKDIKEIEVVSKSLFSNIDTVSNIFVYLKNMCENMFGKNNNCHEYELLRTIITDKIFVYSEGGLFNADRFRKFVINCDNANTMYILSNIVLGYCNKKFLNYLDLCESDDKIDSRYLLNSQLLDIIEIVYREKEPIDTVMRSINEYLEECFHCIPIEFELIRSMIKLKGNIDICDYFKDKKISDMFLVDVVSELPMVGMWNLLNGTNVFNTLLQFKKKNEEGVLSDWEGLLPSNRYIFSYYEAIEHSYYRWLSSSIYKLSNCDPDVFFNNLNRLKCVCIKENDVSGKTKIFGLKKKGIIKSFIRLLIGDQYILIGCFKKTAYIVTSMSDSKIVLIPIFNNNELELLDLLISESNVETVRGRVIQFNKEDDIHDYIPTGIISMEAFNISNLKLDEDANISVIFDKKSTYMNKYNDIHVVLKQNLANANYSAMATDLCALFALIQIIEREVIYNHDVKVTVKEKADATKARMFAKNDFKQYLDEMIKHDKKFNFTDVYSKSDISKNVESKFKLNVSTIGITRFLKALKPF